jgi:hypothetical protein
MNQRERESESTSHLFQKFQGRNYQSFQHWLKKKKKNKPLILKHHILFFQIVISNTTLFLGNIK